ncbi:MAG TPA: DUF2007 domain-containing protein [Bacteroidia bacterium]|jgi:DNA-directed RNA polymerase subunit RPC12/RpoP|nr:DUF2007 domain-containing protein [Bacteroidia bacterium]
MNDWVTVATFMYPHQAAMLQARLESEGIECFLKDKNTAAANPLYSVAIGGVKLQVRADDVERVTPMLKEAGYIRDDSGVKDFTEENAKELSGTVPVKGENIVCPYCGSTEVFQDKTPHWMSLMAIMFLGIPFIFFGKKKYHCFDCGHDFKLEKK